MENNVSKNQEKWEKQTGGKGARPFWKYFLLLVLVVTVGIFWYQKRQEKREKKEMVQVPVKVVRPVKGDLKEVFSITGYIESNATVTVFPKISGTLESLFVDVGDEVTQKEVIARIEEDRYRLSLDEAEAAFAAAESSFNRTENLYQAKAVSKQNYDEARARYDMTKAQLEQARLQYRYTKVLAPISGKVLKRHTSQGSLLSPEVPIVTVADMEDLLVKADLPEDYYSFFLNSVKPITVLGEVPALGTSPKAKIPFAVKTVEPYISADTKSFHVHCTPKERVEEMRPGMFLTLTFVLEERRGVFYLPQKCLVAGNTLWTVEDGRAKKTQFTPEISVDEGFEVPAIFQGRSFIYEGQYFLNNNQKVKVVE